MIMPFFDWLKMVVIAVVLFAAFTLTLTGLVMVVLGR